MRLLGVAAIGALAPAQMLVAPMAVAQTAAPGAALPPPPPLPPASLPTRQQVNPENPPAAPAPAQSHVQEEGAFAPGPCPLADDNVQVAITSVQFTDQNGAPLPAELVSLLQSITPAGGVQPIKQVCDLRDEANFRLRRARYVAAVLVPSQTMAGGVLHLEVVTGRIVEVHVHGDPGPFGKQVLERIDELKHLSPLNAADAERILLGANDIPGLSIQMGLSPDTATGKPGELIGDIHVSYRRFAVVGNVQNYNSTELGRETAYLRVEAYDLLGMGDRTFIAGSSTFDFKKQRTLQAGEQITLDSRGDHLAVVGTLAESRPALPGLDLRTVSTIADLTLDHPIRHTLTTNLTGTAGFEFAEQRTRVYLGGSNFPLNRDRISTLSLRLDADRRFLRFDGTQKADVSASFELRKGVGILGSTKTGVVDASGYTPSRFAGSATPFVLRGHLSGDIGFGPIFELASSVQGQWADREVLNYDEFAIGNLTVGRGYDPGANTADRAFASSSELRANVPLGQRLRGQVYGFYDWVHLWNLDPFSTERSRTLRSVGGGGRLTLVNGLKLDITYAHPLDPPLLTGTNIRRSPDRLMFSLTAQLVPFGLKF